MAEMGRPTKMTKDKCEMLEKICRFKPTLEDCSELLDVNSSTIEKYVRKTFNATFTEFRNQRMAHTRNMIIRNILKQCENGNITMLIYASKNLCGWSDTPKDSENAAINVKYVIQNLKDQI